MPERMVKRAGWRLGAVVVLGLGGGPATASGLPGVESGIANHVPECVSATRLMAFLKRRNPRFDRRFADLARLYRQHGEQLGVRWDVAFFQMMVETAALSFRREDGRPGDVRGEDNNFAGLGAIGDGRPGEAFATPSHGVRAHLEHLLHYAGHSIGEPVAQRTRKVQAWGVLAEWHRQFAGRRITYDDLLQRWAPGNVAYAETVIRLAQQFQRQYCGGRTVIARAPLPRRPEIAATGWAFRLGEGKRAASAPRGEPALDDKRSSLGLVPAPMPAVKPPVVPSTMPQFQVASLIPLPTPHRSGRSAKASAPVTQPQARLRPPVQHQARRDSATAKRTQEPVERPRLDPMVQQEQRIRDLISGRKVLLKTRVGATIPILFDGDGTMRGHAGSLGFFLGASTDSGKWWTAKGRLCQRWRTWLDGETHCIRLSEHGDLIHWQADDGERGTARVVAR